MNCQLQKKQKIGTRFATLKRLAIVMLASVMLPGGFQAAHAALDAVGLTRAATGNFPVWYQDATPLQLELCLSAADNGNGPMCPLLAVPGVFDPAQAIVFPTNFPDESFWFTADAAIVHVPAGIVLRYVAALEAAFANGDVVDGDQISFARIRIRVDVPVTGTYTVTHPYGEEVFVVSAVGPGNEINMTRDIGIGAPGDYTGALTGELGPFLEATGGRITVGTETFIGDPNILTTVAGSPTGNNRVRITGPGGIDVQTNQFNLSGKVFGGELPTDLGVLRSTYSKRATQAHIDVFAASADATSVSFDSTAGGAITMDTDSAGGFYGSELDPSIIPEFVFVTATDTATAGAATTLLTSPVVDVVKITKAAYALDVMTLEVEATSSDETAPLSTLTASNGLGTLGLAGSGPTQVLEVVPLEQPPAHVTVTSSHGGSDTEPVLVVASFNHAPVANGDNYSTPQDTLLSVASPGVLGNDSDADGDALIAVLDSAPGNGTLTLNADGSFSYTPNPGATGLDSFSYHASDGTLDSAAATVSIEVTAALRCSLGNFPSNSPELTMALISRRRTANRYATDYTYTVTFANHGIAAENVTGTVTSTDDGITIVDNSLSFDLVPGSSSDTYTMRWDRRFPLDANNILFAFEGQGAACQ